MQNHDLGNGESQNPSDTLLAHLQQLLPPDVWENGKINYNRLRETLGEDLYHGEQHYHLSWAGKAEARREVQRTTTATLNPDPEGATPTANENAKNTFIEGDNLAVLRTMQRAYFGKIKMIYIDPPYNTGNDYFVYPDDYSENEQEYGKYAAFINADGKVQNLRNADGKLNKLDLWKQNTKERGHYHSAWLNMLYPRLFLARNLLREDGVIFISIDDNEVHNLRLLCNEIFGEENFVAQITNVHNPKGRSDGKFIATSHEYILVYARNRDNTDWNGFDLEEKILIRYNKEEESVENGLKKYREIDLRKTGDNDRKEDRPNLFYYFLYNKKTGKFYPTKETEIPDDFIQIYPTREDGSLGNWRWSIDSCITKIDRLVPKYMNVRKKWGVFEKDYLEDKDTVKPISTWTFKDVNSERGTEQLLDIGFAKGIFQNPKPVGLIKRTLNLATNPDDSDLILDFFAGSCTTAQAVIDLNAEDGGNRQFICVQYPEPTDPASEAYKAGYGSIADIGRARIRKVIARNGVGLISGVQTQAQAVQGFLQKTRERMDSILLESAALETTLIFAEKSKPLQSAAAALHTILQGIATIETDFAAQLHTSRSKLKMVSESLAADNETLTATNYTLQKIPITVRAITDLMQKQIAADREKKWLSALERATTDWLKITEQMAALREIWQRKADGYETQFFRAYRLEQSNFRQWRSEVKPSEVSTQLAMLLDPLQDYKGGDKPLLTEIALKSGYTLTVEVQKKHIMGCTLHALDGNSLLVALSDLTSSAVVAICSLAEKPRKVVALSRLFEGEDGDQTLANIKLQFKDADIRFEVV